MPTNISWTDESWNPVTGCTPVSEGCAHCYAKKMAHRFGGDFSKVTLHPDRLEFPLHWRKPRMVFVPSMGDLFHEDVPDEFIDRVFAAMVLADHHTFQVLTKRPERMQDFTRSWLMGLRDHLFKKVRPHIWLGVSVENQARADERIPLLLDTPAAIRFVSAEPLLGPLDLRQWLPELQLPGGEPARVETVANRFGGSTTGYTPALDWVIVGGESGGPENRRLVERCWCSGHEMAFACGHCAGAGWAPRIEALEWVRSIRDQCQAAGVALWFKQWGPRAGQGTLLDGEEHKEMPEVDHEVV